MLAALLCAAGGMLWWVSTKNSPPSEDSLLGRWEFNATATNDLNGGRMKKMPAPGKESEFLTLHFKQAGELEGTYLGKTRRETWRVVSRKGNGMTVEMKATSPRPDGTFSVGDRMVITFRGRDEMLMEPADNDPGFKGFVFRRAPS
jgi:hypothetical protein